MLINSEVFLDDKKIDRQIEYANKKGGRLVMFKGIDDDLNVTIKIKNYGYWEPAGLCGYRPGRHCLGHAPAPAAI